MPDGYELAELRFAQTFYNISAADALFIQLGPVPNGRIWTITAARGEPSVNETRTFWFSVQPAGTTIAIPVTWPASLAAVVANQQLPSFVKEGMEFKLYPGEQFYVHRDAATAGSTLAIRARVIESDLPLYHYMEPQMRNRLRKKAAAFMETLPMRGGTAPSAGGILGFPVGSPGPREK